VAPDSVIIVSQELGEAISQSVWKGQGFRDTYLSQLRSRGGRIHCGLYRDRLDLGAAISDGEGGGCANGFWHSLAKIVAGFCEPGPSRAAGLAEASHKDSGRQNPLAHPRAAVW
jgi:hypothetical protein